MTSLLINLVILFIGMTDVLAENECYMCDNEAEQGDCGEDGRYRYQPTCTGVACSITSYVRNTATGCQSLF